MFIVIRLGSLIVFDLEVLLIISVVLKILGVLYIIIGLVVVVVAGVLLGKIYLKFLLNCEVLIKVILNGV